MPTLKPSLIDRYIHCRSSWEYGTCHRRHKIDLLHERPASLDEATYEQQLALYEEFIEIYQV